MVCESALDKPYYFTHSKRFAGAGRLWLRGQFASVRKLTSIERIAFAEHCAFASGNSGDRIGLSEQLASAEQFAFS